MRPLRRTSTTFTGRVEHSRDSENDRTASFRLMNRKTIVQKVTRQPTTVTKQTSVKKNEAGLRFKTANH